MPLTKEQIAQLDSNIRGMLDNGASENDIMSYSKDFKAKFESQQQPQKPQLTSSGIPDFSAIVKKSLTPDLKANINPMKAVKGIGVPSKEVAVNIPIKTVEGTFKVPDKLLSPDTITEEQQTLQLPTVTPEVLPLNELLTKGTDYTRQYLQSKKDATQVDFEQQSDVNNVVGAFNREAQVYQKTQEQLKQYADKYEKSLGFRYGSDFIAKMKQERDVLQGEISQFEKYSTKRTAEFQKLNAELEDIQTRYQNGEISEQEAKPAYEAKVAQMKAIEADITSKQQPIKDKQSAFDAKLQDEDFKSYLTVNNKLDEIQNEAQSLITRPEFKEYRDLLDAGDREQAKKDAMKKAYQSKGILGKASDIMGALSQLSPVVMVENLITGESDKTFTGAKVADEGDKLLGRTLKALASVPKMLDISNPIGDENKYDVFDKMFDQAIYASKKRDILNPTATDVQRDIIQKYADVDGYRVMLDENGNPTNDVRDASFYKVNDKTQKEITDKYNENPTAYKTEKDFSASTLTTKATPTILDMGTMMATAMLSGGTTGLVAGAGTAGTVSTATTIGVSAAQMYSDMYESGLSAGLTPQEANDFSTLTSIMTGMVSLVNPMESNIVRGVVGRRVGQILGESLTLADVQLVRSGQMSIGQLAKRTAIEGVKNTFGENLEELVLEPAVQRATETYYNTKAQKNGQQGFEDLNKPFFDTKQTIETAIITSMTSLLMTPIEVANSVPEQRKIALQNALDNPQAFIDLRNSMLNSGDVSQEKFDYEVKAFEEISKQYNAIKPNIKEDLHDDLAELLLKKYTLKNTMSQVGDDILNKKNKVVLDDIDSRLEELVSGTYDKAKETAINNIKENNAPLVADGTAVYNGQEVTIVDDLEDGNVLIDIGNDAIVVPKVELESVDQSVSVINNQNNEQNGKIEEAKGQENVLNTETQVAVDGVGVSPAVTETVETETSTAKPVDKIAKGKTLLAERKLRKKVNENPITPTEPINAGQELNIGTGIQQADGNGEQIQQGDGIGQVSGQEVPTEKVEEGVDKKTDIERRRQEELKERVVYDRFPTVEDGEFKIIGDPNNRIYRINETTGRPQELDESNGLWSNTAFSPNLFMESTKRSGFEKSKNKINAKYDAELAAIETPEVSKPASEVVKPISKTETTENPALKDVESAAKALEGVDTFHLVENEGEWKATTKTYRGREIGNWAISNLDKKQQKEYLKIRDEADTYGTKEQAEENLKKLKDFEQKNKEAFERAKQEIDALKEAEERKAEERKKQQKIFDQTEQELNKLSDKEFDKLVELIDEKRRQTLEQRFGDRVEKRTLFITPISEAYHKAKADGSNPELVKAVEQSLKETTKAETPTPKGNTSNVGVEEGSGVGGDVEIRKKEMKSENDKLIKRKRELANDRDDVVTGEGKYKNFGKKERDARLEEIRSEVNDIDAKQVALQKELKVIEAKETGSVELFDHPSTNHGSTNTIIYDIKNDKLVERENAVRGKTKDISIEDAAKQKFAKTLRGRNQREINEAYTDKEKAKYEAEINEEIAKYKAVEQSLKETTKTETKVAEKGVEEPLQGKELIGDALDRIASKIGSKKNLTEQERTSLTKDISDLAKGLIQMGSATLDNVIDKIKEAIKKRVPELDDKEVDALANNIEDDVIFKATIDEFKELGLSYEEAKSLLDEDNIDYSEQELKDAWGEEPDDSITPPFDDEKQLQTSDGKLREKAVLNKAYDGEKRDEIKAKIEELNLMYEVENQESVVKKVNDLIEEIGIDAAYESVKNNKDKNAVDAVIFDAKIRSVESEMATATGDRYEELITEQARLYDEMGAVGKDMGRFISMLGHIYRTTDLAYSFARQKELYKSVNNGDFPKAIEIKYRELEEAMKSAQRRISELEKEKKEIEDNYNGAINKDEVNKLIAEAYKSGKNSKKKRNIYSQRKEKVERAKKQIAEGLEDFAKAMGSILSAEGLERPSLTKALVKIGKGLIDGGFATVENVFDKIKDNIKDKFGDTVDIENYKDDVNNALSENSKIKIPNSKIKDIVARRRELGLDTKIEDVVKELQEEYPDYSERDIRDAVSGYGVTKELKPGDDATVRKIKRMGRYESILEDILNEKRPLRTGTQRDKIEADERAKLKEIYQKLKNLPVDATDLSKQLKTAQDAIVAHLENSIEDLDRQIKTGERPEKNKPLETTPEIDALRKRRDELLSIRNNIDNPPKSDLEKLVEKAIDFTNKINQAKKEGKKQDEEWLKKQKELTDGSISNLIDTVIKLNTNPQEVELARKVKAKENEILKLQEKLDNNDLSKQEQKQTITSPELDALIEQKRLLTDELAQRRKSDEEGNLYTNTVNKLQELSDKSADKKIPKEAVKSGLISDLIESYINNGTPLAEIQEKVVNELSSIFPNSDVLQIRDAILRQGDYKTVTKEMSDLRKKIAEFKIQLNLQKKVENARQGVIDIAKTKGESSPELIKARKELAQARKEAVDRFPSASIKNIEKNIRQTQNRINEINRKTKAGEFEKKKQAKKMFMNDPAWKAKFDELKQKNIEKIKAQYKFDLEQEKARMKNRSIPRKSFDFIVDLLGLPKSLVATIDLSAPLRQGIGLGVYNPKEFFKAFWHMHGFATSQKKYDKFFNALKSTEEYHIMTQSGLSITNTTGKADAREDVFMNKLAKKIPIYGIFYKGSERAYSGFLNMLRIDVFNKGVEHLKLQGITFEENPEQYEALARTINNATGRGELGATGEKIARELGLVFFSPRMLTSRVGMVSDIFRPDTPKYARTVAFGNAIGLASYIMTIHALGALIMSAADDEEKGVTFKEVMEKLSFNIIDTDFLKNTYPGKNTKGETTKYDFSTGFSILLRTIARMSVGKKIVRSRRTGEKEERSLRDGGAYRESGADEFSQFIKNKLSPTARVIYSLPVFANQDLEDYKEKFEWGTALKSLVVPLNVKEALGEDNFEWQKKDYHGIPYYSPKTIKGSDWDINQEKYWTDRILSAYGVSIMTY